MNSEPEVKISIANCAGRSNIGQMSSEIAKRLDKALPYANINCLPAIFPKLKPAGKFKEADAIVVIDGCDESCVLETIKFGGFTPALRIAPDVDYGIEKTPGLDYDREVMEKITNDVIEKVKKLAEDILRTKQNQTV